MMDPMERETSAEPMADALDAAGNLVKDDVSVDSGHVDARKGKGILRASAIGSCVVVAAYDPASRVGSLAHVMLPGVSRNRDVSMRTKYAEDAVQEMLHRMTALGATTAGLRACLVGGGNVLGEDHESPGPETARSLTEILGRSGIEPIATSLGGMERRSCTLDVASGRVTITVGDSAERTLWEALTSSRGPSGARSTTKDRRGHEQNG
jgi:chemotaxis protein CheD